MKKLFLSIIAIFIFSFAASAQLRSYTFSYNDEFGTKQKCYLTLRSIVAEWDEAQLNVLFNCYESEQSRARKIQPKKIFVMNLTGADFQTNVMKLITAGDKDKPLALLLSDSAWTIAETYKFIDDYSFDEEKEQMISSKKSLNDLNAVKVDVPLQ